jgi:hypothetical protein
MCKLLWGSMMTSARLRSLMHWSVKTMTVTSLFQFLRTIFRNLLTDNKSMAKSAREYIEAKIATAQENLERAYDYSAEALFSGGTASMPESAREF